MAVYEKILSLESGQRFGCQGRPLPTGPTAFSDLKNISAQVTQTRSFRPKLEQGQAMLDHLG